MPVHTASGPIDVLVDIGAGRIEVATGASTEVVAEVLPNNPGRSGDASLADSATVTFEAGRLTVRVPRRSSLFGQGDAVEVALRIPAGSSVDLRVAYGSVAARGALGDARITAKYGNVTAEQVHDLVLVAPYCEAEVGVVGGSLDLAGGHGTTRIGRVDGPSRVRASHGTVGIGVAGGPVDAELAGTLTIDRALADVSARSAHGPIRVREATRGVIRLENAHAEVEVGVPAGTAAWIDAESEHGRVRSELDADPAAAEAEQALELRLRSAWADVLVRRVPPTGATA